MEGVMEGLTPAFIDALAALAAFSGGVENPVSIIVFRSSAAILIVLAIRSVDVRLRGREVLPDNFPEFVVDSPEYHDPGVLSGGLIISGSPRKEEFYIFSIASKRWAFSFPMRQKDWYFSPI